MKSGCVILNSWNDERIIPESFEILQGYGNGFIVVVPTQTSHLEA
jgi:hypothetical protein